MVLLEKRGISGKAGIYQVAWKSLDFFAFGYKIADTKTLGFLPVETKSGKPLVRAAWQPGSY